MVSLYRNQVLTETIGKEKKSLQRLSDLNLDFIEAKCPKPEKISPKQHPSTITDEDKHAPPSTRFTKLFGSQKDADKSYAADMRFDLNPYNKCI